MQIQNLKLAHFPLHDTLKRMITEFEKEPKQPPRPLSLPNVFRFPGKEARKSQKFRLIGSKQVILTNFPSKKRIFKVNNQSDHCRKSKEYYFLDSGGNLCAMVNNSRELGPLLRSPLLEKLEVRRLNEVRFLEFA